MTRLAGRHAPRQCGWTCGRYGHSGRLPTSGQWTRAGTLVPL